MMKAFLSAGASPNATTNDGSTPLHRVTERLRSPIAEVCIDLLIGAGAAVNAKNNLEQSPLHLAADKIELVAKLLSIPGICVNVINRFNKTPLDYAGSDPDIVLLLKAHGAVYGAELRCCIS
jgi:ankyrin repeat protein